jgi:transposase-like protein
VGETLAEVVRKARGAVVAVTFASHVGRFRQLALAALESGRAVVAVGRGLVESLDEVFPDVPWQRCVVHFYRNVLSSVPREKMRAVAAMLKAIHAQESREEAARKAEYVAAKLREMKLATAAKTLENGYLETLSYYAFPAEHHRSIRTNNPLERINREIRRRTRVVGAFPDGKAALMLVVGRLRYITNTKWGTHRYLDMDRLSEMEHLKAG